ncbi:hypothetical protein HRR80_007249 [Exophiala dermatitidis]|nr:hypothetical protein HRR77_006437 [Exophiala dermatitidis]KAJ4548363.1 hypothetical protein HRR76_000967 [Exophiala dermatitidis]KAJ4562979.1 hypothetical protein HRR79_006570 [Exophiala dermatitidis]KAJ4574791.1 hypothetical protein HRR82_006245 [Exophiala dermatitidis]KAJ4609516.1 hypothetical protein HRR85_006703 [Exophiala dermatitidis]
MGVVAVAAVVTPLGLYDDIAPSKEPQPVPFVYMADAGPMGYGTPPRSDLGFTRICGATLPVQCPGTTVAITYSGNDTYMEANITNDDYDMRIPRELAELYQSGLAQQPQSVSSFFDIQSRQYSFQTQQGALGTPGATSGGDKYIVDAFRYLMNMVLNDAIEPIEGLVVDTVTGGVGFRNHTVPAPGGATLGAEWTEDLLWIEPETACVDTNVSVEFSITSNGLYSNELANISLVDNGGFANLVPKYPRVNVTNSQVDPDLQGRAYKAAWMVNAYTMMVMNLTRPNPNAFGYLNSKVGNKYPVTSDQTMGVRLNGIYITSSWFSLLDPDAYLSNYTLADVPAANYSNPWGITAYNYSDIALICSGAGAKDLANLTNIHVACGLVFGAARRLDGSKSLVLEPDTWWTQPVYSCASAMKASIKQVRFRYNATELTGDTLKALTVTNVTDKMYPDQKSMPLWGVESPALELADVPQLWGLISPEREDSVNLSTIRSPRLYLPGFAGVLTGTSPGQENLPAADGLTDVLAGVYQGSSSTGDMADYTGTANMAMYARWRDLSSSATTMKKIPNFIWTDLAANMLIGTRSWISGSDLPGNLQKRDGVGNNNNTATKEHQATVPVTLYERRIRYHWTFAIPAFMALALFLLVLSATVIAMLSRRGVPEKVRHYLHHLSSGRLLGILQYPDERGSLAPTKEWIARVGTKPGDLNKCARDSDVDLAASPSNYQHHGMIMPEKQDSVADTSEVRPDGKEETDDHGSRGGYMRVPNNAGESCDDRREM